MSPNVFGLCEVRSIWANAVSRKARVIRCWGAYYSATFSCQLANSLFGFFFAFFDAFVELVSFVVAEAVLFLQVLFELVASVLAGRSPQFANFVLPFLGFTSYAIHFKLFYILYFIFYILYYYYLVSLLMSFISNPPSYGLCFLFSCGRRPPNCV